MTPLVNKLCWLGGEAPQFSQGSQGFESHYVSICFKKFEPCYG